MWKKNSQWTHPNSHTTHEQLQMGRNRSSLTRVSISCNHKYLAKVGQSKEKCYQMKTPTYTHTAHTHTHSVRNLYSCLCVDPGSIHSTSCDNVSSNRISIFFSFAMIAASQPHAIHATKHIIIKLRILIWQCHGNDFAAVRERVRTARISFTKLCMHNKWIRLMHTHAHHPSLTYLTEEATTTNALFYAWNFPVMALSFSLSHSLMMRVFIWCSRTLSLSLFVSVDLMKMLIAIGLTKLSDIKANLWHNFCVSVFVH